MVTKERPKVRDIESTFLQIPNMVSCEIVTGIQSLPFIIAHLPLANMYRLPDLEEAFNNFLGRDTIVMGDLNTDVGQLVNH